MAKEELPVDKGWAWAVCGAVFIITFLLSATGQMISVTLLDLVARYDTTITTVSLMFMFQIASTSVCSIIATNFLVPRFGIRNVCVVSAVVTVAASMIFTVSPSIYMCIALYAIKGACNGLIAIPAISILGFYFRKHRSIATSLAMCGICSGSIAYPPFVRYILAIYGLQGTYLVCSAIEAHMVFACLLIRPITMYRLPPPPSEKPQEESPEKEELNNYQMKTSGPTELTDPDVDNYFNEKDADKSLLDKTPDGHRLYQKKNVPTKEPSHIAHIKARTVSFTSDDGVDSSPKESLLITNSTDNNSPNHQELSSREKISKMRDAYQRNRTASVNSEDALQYKRRMLKEGQRPSLWSLASNPSTLGIPQEPEIKEVEEDEKSQSIKGSCWRRVNQIFDFSLFRQWAFVWMLVAALPCGTNQLIFLYLPTVGYFRGATKDESALLLTIMGAVDLVSRLCIGVFADKKLVKISTIIGSASVCLGIVAMFIELCTDLTSLIIMSVGLGLFVGIRMSLGTVMFIEIVGLEKMAKGFSLYAMFLTMSGAIHNPLLGRMMETLGVESLMYYLAFTFILGGVMVWSLPLVMRAERQCKNIQTTENVKKQEP